MLRLTKKLIFAIDAVVDIAYNAAEAPVQSKEIAQRQGIPRRYLEQVLQNLVKAEILRGVRGPRGGYRLARERRRISLGEITRIVDQMEGTADPLEEPGGSELGRAVLYPLWLELQEAAMQRLDEVSIEDLCTRARAAGVKCSASEMFDFMI